MNLAEGRRWTEHILTEFSRKMSVEEMSLPQHSADDWLRNLISDIDAIPRERIESEFYADGPLDSLLRDERVTEILINGPRRIWFERDGSWSRLEDEFLSLTTFKNWVQRLSNEAGIGVDLDQAFGNGRWRDFRVHLACAPIVSCDFHISLRRHATTRWTLDRLAGFGWADARDLLTLKALVRAQDNVLIVGPTGCGKTSVLSACLGELDVGERVILIEDTDELPLPNESSSKLLTRQDLRGTLKSYDLTDLLKQSLRMRPQRLVIGEVRGGEAKDLMMALATGHRGSFGTLHARDAKQALLRLEMLIQMGAPQWNTHAIRQLIALSLDHIVVCGFEGSQRRLNGIFRLASLETCGFLLEPLHTAQARTSI